MHPRFKLMSRVRATSTLKGSPCPLESQWRWLGRANFLGSFEPLSATFCLTWRGAICQWRMTFFGYWRSLPILGPKFVSGAWDNSLSWTRKDTNGRTKAARLWTLASRLDQPRGQMANQGLLHKKRSSRVRSEDESGSSKRGLHKSPCRKDASERCLFQMAGL